MGRMARLAVVAVLTLAVLLSFRTLNGLDAGASLLVAMAALKLMETQQLRDWLIVLGASLFLLLAACLDAQTLWRIPLYAAEVWLLCTVLFALGAGVTPPSPATLLRSSARSIVLALPFALLLFLCFPRLSGSLWSVPKEDEAITGLGQEMSPGSFSQLSESDEPALRVRFEGELPPQAERYWRGPVLHRFDGVTWRRAFGDLGPPPKLDFAGRSYRYEVTLEPNTHGVLIALEMPRGKPAQSSYVSFDDQIISAKPLSDAHRYQLESFTKYRSEQDLNPTVRQLDLALPRGRNPRSLALARRLRDSASDDRAFVEAAFDYLQHGGFEYTLTPPRLGVNSVDDLLFDTRQGFCGHYASAFATLMRAGGVPARVVTGYLGGEWNRFGDYLLIRQSNAHAWTEVWLAGMGWVRIDPTAAVAPDRLHRDLDDVPVGSGASDSSHRTLSWLATTLQAWQAANAWWRDEFIDFNMSKQLHLLGALGLKDRYLESLVALLAAGATLWLSLLAWRGRQRSAALPRDILSRSWRALERALTRAGAPRAPYEGPIAYSERVAGDRPDLAATLRPLARNYARLRYGSRSSAAQLQRFHRAVRFFTARLRG
jgi:transglutaminase-like putative cysteine protease